MKNEFSEFSILNAIALAAALILSIAFTLDLRRNMLGAVASVVLVALVFFPRIAIKVSEFELIYRLGLVPGIRVRFADVQRVEQVKARLASWQQIRTFHIFLFFNIMCVSGLVLYLRSGRRVILAGTPAVLAAPLIATSASVPAGAA